MPRGKVKFAWLDRSSDRKSFFRRRKKGMLKKMHELTTLCDVPGFVIFYNPDTNEVMEWPNRQVVEELLAKFHELPINKRSEKMLDLETYLKGKVEKLREELDKTRRERMNHLLHQFRGGKQLYECEFEELSDLNLFLGERLLHIHEMTHLRERQNLQSTFLTTPTPALDSALPLQGVNSINHFENWKNMSTLVDRNEMTTRFKVMQDQYYMNNIASKSSDLGFLQGANATSNFENWKNVTAPVDGNVTAPVDGNVMPGFGFMQPQNHMDTIAFGSGLGHRDDMHNIAFGSGLGLEDMQPQNPMNNIAPGSDLGSFDNVQPQDYMNNIASGSGLGRLDDHMQHQNEYDLGNANMMPFNFTNGSGSGWNIPGGFL